MSACSECSAPADYRCTSNKVGPRRKVRRNGVDLIEEPFLEFDLCDPCARVAATSPTPPPIDHRAAAQGPRTASSGPRGACRDGSPRRLGPTVRSAS